MINDIFDICVQLLMTLAAALGMTYKAINVWVFVVIWPLFTIVLVVIIVRQKRKIKSLETQH